MDLYPLLLGAVICLLIAALLGGFLRIFLKRAQEYKERHREEQWNEAMDLIVAGESKGSLEAEKEIMEIKKNGRT